MMSVAVVCSAPVIAVTAMRWMDVSRLVTPTDLEALVPRVPRVTGVYQTSTAYVNLGTATAQ